MKELIGVAVLVATLFSGTMAAEKIYVKVRQEALTKASQGLPRLSMFTKVLTDKSKNLVRCKKTKLDLTSMFD